MWVIWLLIPPLAIDPVKAVRTQDYVSAGGGTLDGNGIIAGNFGSAVKLTFTHAGSTGTTLSITDLSPFGEGQDTVLLPGQSHTFLFALLTNEPIDWSFDVSSSAFVGVYTVESTWVEGMPPQPCF